MRVRLDFRTSDPQRDWIEVWRDCKDRQQYGEVCSIETRRGPKDEARRGATLVHPRPHKEKALKSGYSPDLGEPRGHRDEEPDEVDFRAASIYAWLWAARF